MPADQAWVKTRSHTASILLLHGGELSDVRALLDELGVPYVERRGEVTRADREAGWDVVVSTAQLGHKFPSGPGSPTTRIAVLGEESRTLRAMLRRAGYHYVVRRPVHPTALRLVLLHALYRGPEKRRKRRVTVGAPVRVRIGLRRSAAVLADLSVTGCRLLGPGSLQVGQRLRLGLPRELTGGRVLRLGGRVVRVDTSGDERTLAIAFEGLSARSAQRLADVVHTHSSGPAVLGRTEPTSPAPPSAALPSPPPEPAAASGDPAERRTDPRRQMSRHVIALDDESARVLMGRDISLGGMRVERHEGLSLGDQVQLALHVRAREEPLVVSARVTRDDGDGGLVLQFFDLSEQARKYLERMVHMLPVLAMTDEDESEAGVIVSEILEREIG